MGGVVGLPVCGVELVVLLDGASWLLVVPPVMVGVAAVGGAEWVDRRVR